MRGQRPMRSQRSQGRDPCGARAWSQITGPGLACDLLAVQKRVVPLVLWQ